MSAPRTPDAPASATAASGADRQWSVLELLRWTTDHFGSRGIEGARLDAECLLAHALGVSRVQLYIDFEKPVAAPQRAAFRELVRQRASERVPVSQLTGVKEFWSLSLKVTNEVLTPRPDTETLVQAAFDRLPDREGGYRVLDLGTGTGAIALAIASERPKAHIVATDISLAALQVAAENADELQLSEMIEFRAGDLFEPLDGETFDLVVSNPPYLRADERESVPPELAHEPAVALYAGPDGLDVVRRLVAQVSGVLVPGGSLLVEIDPGQVETVKQLGREAGLEQFEVLRDLAKRERAIVARRPASR